MQILNADLSLLESSLYFSYEPLESLRGESELFRNALGAQGRAHQALEQERSIGVCLSAESVVARHDDTLLQ